MKRVTPSISVFGLGGALLACAACMACTSGEAEPSTGTYTVTFPSTEAAVATDSVQLFVFDVPNPAERAFRCQELLQTGTRGEPWHPIVENPPVSTCSFLAGAEPATVPYGEHAVVALGVRKG